MNNLNKNHDAHCRLARGVQRFSRAYMKSAEFKVRQLWLDFKDSAGTALQAIADTVDASRKTFKSWLRKFNTKPVKKQTSVQLQFNFLCWLDVPVGTST